MAKPLAQLRKERNLTQQALADRSRVGQSTISEIEAGIKAPRLDTGQKIANALGVPLGEIEFPKLARQAAS